MKVGQALIMAVPVLGSSATLRLCWPATLPFGVNLFLVCTYASLRFKRSYGIQMPSMNYARYNCEFISFADDSLY